MNGYVEIRRNGDNLDVEFGGRGADGIDMGEIAKKIKEAITEAMFQVTPQEEGCDSGAKDDAPCGETRCASGYCESDDDDADCEDDDFPDIVNVVYNKDDPLSAYVLPSIRYHPAYVAARLLFVAADLLADWVSMPEEKNMLDRLQDYAVSRMENTPDGGEE